MAPQVEQRRGGACSAEPQRVEPPREQQQDEAGHRHPRVDDDAFEEGASGPAHGAGQGVVDEVAHGPRHGVLDQLPVAAREDRRVHPIVEGERREGEQRENGVDQIGARDAEPPDQQGRQPELDADLHQVGGEEVEAKEDREVCAALEGLREDVAVEVLEDEEREHHGRGRQREPAADGGAANDPDGASYTLDGGVVGFRQIEGPQTRRFRRW